MAYSDEEKAEALIKLAINGHNLQRTAAETGIHEKTLRRWANRTPSPGVGYLLERAVKHLLARIPENIPGKDWAVAVGILMDKWLLVNGMANNRFETIMQNLEGVTADERDSIMAEAERILAGEDRRGPGSR